MMVQDILDALLSIYTVKLFTIHNYIQHGGIIILRLISVLISLIIIISPAALEETVITVSGSTSMLPLIAAAAEAFNDLQKDYFVTVTGGHGARHY